MFWPQTNWIIKAKSNQLTRKRDFLIFRWWLLLAPDRPDPLFALTFCDTVSRTEVGSCLLLKQILFVWLINRRKRRRKRPWPDNWLEGPRTVAVNTKYKVIFSCLTNKDRPNPLLGAACCGGLPFNDDRSDSSLYTASYKLTRTSRGQAGQITFILHIWTGLRFEGASPKCTAVLSHSMCLLLSSFDVDTVAVCRRCCQDRVLSLYTDTCLVRSLHWNWRTAASNQVEHNSHAAHTTATVRTQPPVPLPVLPRLQGVSTTVAVCSRHPPGRFVRYTWLLLFDRDTHVWWRVRFMKLLVLQFLHPGATSCVLPHVLPQSPAL